MFFKFNLETYLTYFDRLLETLLWIVVAKNLTWGSMVKFLFYYFDTSMKKLTLARICPRNIYLNLFCRVHFHWRSLKACNIVKKICFNYVRMVTFPWSFCSLRLQILRLFRAKCSKTIECRFTLKHQKQPPEVFCKKGSSLKFHKIHRKIQLPSTGIFLWILQNF